MGGQAPTEHVDFNGTIWKVGQNLAWDPHAEKGTGLHCVNLDDNNLYPFRHNRFAFYCHDIPSGAASNTGPHSAPTPKPVKNIIYLLAVNLTDVAQIQTGGNGIQFWGVNGQSAEVKFIQVDNAQGYALWDGGMNRGTNLRASRSSTAEPRTRAKTRATRARTHGRIDSARSTGLSCQRQSAAVPDSLRHLTSSNTVPLRLSQRTSP